MKNRTCILLAVYNDNHKDFIRYGEAYAGIAEPRHEILIVDENSNIDPSTPV